MDKRRFIGEQLKRARIPKTQEQVAGDVRGRFAVHMTQRILSDLETGKRDLTAEELSAFCRYFGLRPEYFIETPQERVREPRTATYPEEGPVEHAILEETRLNDEQKDILVRLFRDMTTRATR